MLPGLSATTVLNPGLGTVPGVIYIPGHDPTVGPDGCSGRHDQSLQVTSTTCKIVIIAESESSR
jgi:hypothetical protein